MVTINLTKSTIQWCENSAGFWSNFETVVRIPQGLWEQHQGQLPKQSHREYVECMVHECDLNSFICWSYFNCLIGKEGDFTQIMRTNNTICSQCGVATWYSALQLRLMQN